MKEVIKIKAKIVHVSEEQLSQRGKGTYFIIRLKGDDDAKYDVLPSSDTREYEQWKELARNGVGCWFEGFQYGGKGKYHPYMNKHVLPHKLEEEVTNTLL